MNRFQCILALGKLPGFVDVLQLQLECVVGFGVEPQVWRNAVAPLTICFDFVQLFVIMRLLGGVDRCVIVWVVKRLDSETFQRANDQRPTDQPEAQPRTD